MAYRRNMSIFDFEDKPTYEKYLLTLADTFLNKENDECKAFFHRETQYFLEEIFYMRARIENFIQILPVAMKIYGDGDENVYREKKQNSKKLSSNKRANSLLRLNISLRIRLKNLPCLSTWKLMRS